MVYCLYKGHMHCKHIERECQFLHMHANNLLVSFVKLANLIGKNDILSFCTFKIHFAPVTVNYFILSMFSYWTADLIDLLKLFIY